MTRLEEVISEIVKELNQAEQKHPLWPTDPLHALAVVQEEVGELNKEILQFTYEAEAHKSSRIAIKAEAVQAAAMALRFLLGLPNYRYAKAAQVNQYFKQSRDVDDSREDPMAVKEAFVPFTVRRSSAETIEVSCGDQKQYRIMKVRSETVDQRSVNSLVTGPYVWVIKFNNTYLNSYLDLWGTVPCLGFTDWQSALAILMSVANAEI